MKVYLVGVGMGNPDTLTIGAKSAIDESDLIIGAKRMIAPYVDRGCRTLDLIRADDIAAAIDAADERQACVLLSGDIGFYSGATALYDKLPAHDVRPIPGISSLVYFSAQLHTTWQDAVLVSAHGRDHDAVGAIQSNEKVFCIAGGKTKVEDICRSLVQRGLGDVPVAAGERLSYDDERIVRGTARELAERSFDDLAVLMAFNPHPVKPPFAAPALADDAFLRGKAPMTKQEVRALVVCKLRIAPDAVVWDVGAGTGSVSVEMAYAAHRGTVWAVERNAAAVQLLHRNRDRFGLSNLNVVEGLAPEALRNLPAPDRVFVGGSAGHLAEIVQLAVQKNPDVAVCVTAVTIETMAEAAGCLRDAGAAHVDIVQVAVSRADAVGGYHLMRAENPVHIFTAGFGNAFHGVFGQGADR